MKQKWNERYKNMAVKPPVNSHLKRLVKELPKGRALDIGCGMGQNSEFLASMGWKVDAVDISEVGLSKIVHKNINTFCQTIKTFLSNKKSEYDLILSINFLPSNFKAIESAVKPGGYFLIQTFTPNSSMNPRFTIAPNKLLRAFHDMRILYYVLTNNGQQILLVAQKPLESF